MKRLSARVSTGIPRLDAMLGGGLLPGTLSVVYGATGIGKTPDGAWAFDWNWKATYNHALHTVLPFFYFHFAAGTRRVVVDGVEPMDQPADSIQFWMFDELYRKTIHRDAETLGMEICLPVWKHRAFIDAHGYD